MYQCTRLNKNFYRKKNNPVYNYKKWSFKKETEQNKKADQIKNQKVAR